MAIVATNRYLQSLARGGTAQATGSGRTTVGLYTDTITPSDATNLADLTSIASASLSMPTSLATEIAGWWVQERPVVAWVVAGGGSGVTVRGWYVAQGGSLVYAENLSPAITVPVGESRLIELSIRTRARQV